MTIEEPDPRPEEVKQSKEAFSYAENVEAFARKMHSFMRLHSVRKKDRWTKMNPLELLQKLLESFSHAQASSSPESWVHLANYAMMLYFSGPQKQGLIQRSPKLIAFAASPQAVEALNLAIRKGAITINLSKISEDPAQANLTAQTIHTFFQSLEKAMLHLTEKTYEGQ